MCTPKVRLFWKVNEKLDTELFRKWMKERMERWQVKKIHQILSKLI